MRRLAIRALGALALLAAVSLATWWAVGRHLENRVLAWVERQRADGVTVEFSALGACGPPPGWTICAADVVLARREPTFREWRAARVELRLLPWRLDEVEFRVPGKQRATRETPWRAAETIEFEAVRPEGRIRLAQGRAVELQLDLEGVTARRLPDGARAAADRLRFVGARFDPPDGRIGESLRAALDIGGLAVPGGPAGFAERIAAVGLEFALRGPFDPDRPPRESVPAWRDAGGTLEIARLALDWAPLSLAGDGTLALDAESRPLGAFTLRATGYGEAIDALAQAGALRAREAAAVKAALNLLARADGPDGRRQVRLPLTMQDGRLSVAGFAIQRLEPLRFD